ARQSRSSLRHIRSDSRAVSSQSWRREATVPPITSTQVLYLAVMRARQASRFSELSHRDWPKNAQLVAAGLVVVRRLEVPPKATAFMHSCLPWRLTLRHSPSSRPHWPIPCWRRASTPPPANDADPEEEFVVVAFATLCGAGGAGKGVALIASTADCACGCVS